MWHDDIDFPSVDEPEQQGWVVPEFDLDWNDWWEERTYHRTAHLLRAALGDVEADAA